jgi:N-acetylmuramoyl-L-alanine amidase
MPARAGWLLVSLAVVLATAWNVSRWPRHQARRASTPATSTTPRVPTSALDPQRWPGPDAPLTRLPASFPDGPPLRVLIDPGHGAPNNHGNTSSLCVEEQDAMQGLAAALAERLQATGHVEARLARLPGQAVEYSARLAEAARWDADAFVSLHSDVRGQVARWSPSPGQDCPVALDAPGFAVLYADEGPPELTARREALGRAVARRMIEAGFLAYGGAEYAGIYAPDAPGAFVDRHPPEQRIFVLRRAAMPSILVETHNALDPREAARWVLPETLDAFAAAVAAALADVVARPASAASVTSAPGESPK